MWRTYLKMVRLNSSMWAIAVALSALPGTPAFSDVSGDQRLEVVHLLEFIRNTPCTVERNGKKYQGPNAYSHVRRKYAYFRDDIATTEEFIEYSATMSTRSGKHYVAHCEGRPPVPTQEWLLEELDFYRNNNSG